LKGLRKEVAGSETFSFLGKLAFHRPRPELAMYIEHSFSFPSGHATIAVAFYGFAGYLLMRFAPGWKRKVNILFATIFIIMAIGFSRIYLGVHYISDVWSGYLVGAIWLIIAISFFEWFEHQARSGRPVSPVAFARPISFILVVIAVLSYVGFAINYHPQLVSAPLSSPVAVSKVSDIFTNEQLKYTETLIGEKQEPVNFIFLAKDDGQLLAVLQQAGWKSTDKANVLSSVEAVKALLLKNLHYSAPISPSFWNMKMQDLSFAKMIGEDRPGSARHLKIWHTNSFMADGNIIYVAMVNANDGFKWGVIPRISPDLDSDRELLYQDLISTAKIESHTKMQFVKPLIGKNFMGDQFFTDGDAYIMSVK